MKIKILISRRSNTTYVAMYETKQTAKANGLKEHDLHMVKNGAWSSICLDEIKRHKKAF